MLERGLAVLIREVVARPARPRRWTFPITALRVTSPSFEAIWLALKPSAQCFFKSSTRSSVQLIVSSSYSSADEPRIRDGAAGRMTSGATGANAKQGNTGAIECPKQRAVAG